MALQITPLDLQAILGLTMVLVAVKVVLACYLGWKLAAKTKDTGKMTFGFAFGVFVLMACLLAGRLLYMVFDFALTGFDEALFHVSPLTWWWKAGSLMQTLGYAVFIFIVDRKLLAFKLKGIIAYALLALAAVQFLYPVSDAASFNTASLFGLAANAVAIVIPVFFFVMAKKSPEHKVACLAIAIGVIVYAIGANITVEPVIVAFGALTGEFARITLHALSLACKVSGLVMFSLGVTNLARKIT